ncbi:hypothetical protein FA13DRAFT_1751820 [Coprinellus micaceus]|uniref:Ketoreductase (KR) domain-containing protein n=1 Tax=Coprinellus micaceus TaxID=71717 RepID=A0A4Y7TUT8_COPMI|nr:hypothetical protein FA13DRAFT_1751820 [Coprinellus micaceus]
MVLALLESIYTSPLLSPLRTHLPHILLSCLAIYVLHLLSQGRKTGRDRDLHARTVLLTGAFDSALGITLLVELAKRGASVQPTGDYGDPHIHTLVSLTCDIEDPASVKQFCVRWLTGGSDPTSKEALQEKETKAKEPSLEGQGGGAAADQRLDAIVFTHEYASLGSQQTRERRSLGSFLMTTLLLPSLLIAPVERDIRIVNVVNPFYAAAVKGGDHTFTSASTSSLPSAASPSKASVFLSEGIRSLRTIIFTRHLQRILDALPAPQAPQTEGTASEIPIPARHLQRSNIVAVSVSPGIGRVDTVGRLVEGDWEASAPPSALTDAGDDRYILLQPFLRIFTKSPSSAVQSVLHALFLPTAFKSVPSDTTDEDAVVKKTGGNKLRFREVLKPGALYGECAVVSLDVPAPPPSATATPQPGTSKTKAKASEGKTKSAKEGGQEEVIEIEDDGEYGGEDVGRRVWEAYEGALKVWEGEAARNAGEWSEEQEGRKVVFRDMA